MSINQRQAQLLKTLLDEPSYSPTPDVARELSCSERTVRNDMRATNAFLEQMGIAARVESKRGNGIRLAGDATQRERIGSIIKERALAMDGALDRFYRGMLLLTCDFRQSYTTESLARAILTNKQQAQDDLRRWNELLTPFGAQIVRGRKISIEGPEEYIRFFVVYYLFELASTAMRRRIEPQLFGDNWSFFEELINDTEAATGIPYTDNARHQIAVYLQLSVLRVLKGRTITGYADAVPAPYEALADRLEERFAIELSANERSVIRDLFTVSTRRWTPDFQRAFVPTSEAAQLSSALFDALAEHFGVRPAPDLEKPAAALIEAGLTHRRFERAIALPQENTWAVRYENMPAFLRLTEVLHDTPQLARLGFYQTDVTRLAMLLLSYMDGLSTHERWSVGLVVNCGIEQVFYARNRLERLMTCIRVERVLTDREATAADAVALEGLDFLISFDPVKVDKPLCVIGSGIDETDRAHIEALIMRLGRPRASEGEAALENGMPERELQIAHPRMLCRALFTALAEEGLWSGSLDAFSPIFEAQAFMHGDWMILPLHVRGVAKTGAVHYKTSTRFGFTGEKLTHVLVLCISLEDERVLTPVTQRFRLLAEEAGLRASTR